MPTLESETELNLPEESQDNNYPDGEAEAGAEKEDELMLELTMEELKEAFRLEIVRLDKLSGILIEGYLTT